MVNLEDLFAKINPDEDVRSEVEGICDVLASSADGRFIVCEMDEIDESDEIDIGGWNVMVIKRGTAKTLAYDDRPYIPETYYQLPDDSIVVTGDYDVLLNESDGIDAIKNLAASSPSEAVDALVELGELDEDSIVVCSATYEPGDCEFVPKSKLEEVHSDRLRTATVDYYKTQDGDIIRSYSSFYQDAPEYQASFIDLEEELESMEDLEYEHDVRYCYPGLTKTEVIDAIDAIESD